MSDKPFFARDLNVQDILTVNTTVFAFGANIVMNLNDLTIGNSSVNSFSNSTLQRVGGVSLNTIAVVLGANVFLDTTKLSVGNSTVNLTANSILVSVANSSGIVNINPTSILVGTAGINTTSAFVGDNVFLNQSTLSIGNSSVNVAIISTLVRVSNSSGVANLEPTLLKIGGSTLNSTSINTSFVGTITANITGNGRIFSLGVGGEASGVQGRMLATENIISFFSDKRLKHSLWLIQDALYKIGLLGGYHYYHNDLAKKYGYNTEERQVGVLAQEVQEVLPEAVHLAPFDIDHLGFSKSGENYLTVQYEKLIPLIIQAIKEVNCKVERLESCL